MFQIIYDPEALHDLSGLDKGIQRKIIRQIYKKLIQAPQDYGKPLQNELKGFWRLRVDDYRVIYEIVASSRTVIIWHIGQRKDDQVYLEFLKRIR